MTVKATDDYRKSFKKEEVIENFIFIALKFTGEVLPSDHGFPARLVTKDLSGGRWMKWIT